MKYEKLFQPGKIGNLELRNRVVMTAMGALMGDWNGCTTPEQIRFYEDRAKGGCGLIIPEFTSVDADSGHCNPIQLGIYDSRQIKSFQLICEAVHRHGAKIFIQLHHGGREAPPACNGGRQAMAPSVELNSVVGRATILPREMTIEDIDNLVEKYVQAAVNSELAGADGVEVHAAHGYLVQQFLSPYTNKRTDEYGGSMENRCRFLVRILTGIRAAVSRDFVVGARINGNDFVEGGNDLAACTEIAKYLEPYVDYFNVSCGVYASAPTMIEPCYSPEGWRKNLAKTIKAAVNVPVIAVNTIKHPETAERFLQEGVSDFVGMSRMQLADPDVVKKAMAGREDLIRKCLGCMNCNKSVVAGKNLHCAINPVTGRATVYGDENLVKTGAGRTVAVVGGGDPATLTDEYWLNVINTDLNGQFFTCREVVRQSMKPNQYGRIIMVSSIHGVCGRKGVDTAPYAAAKGGIVNLTRSLGNSWARDGITVNCICPGYFPTEMTAAYIDAPFFHQAHLECCPMERHGETGEMDGLCTYFASPACSYTTGQIVCVDGGWSAI